jgi:hypothetical protein
MLRIEPAYAPLWRSSTCLQFGADAVAVVEDPALWQQRLVRELERGIPEEAVGPFAESLGAPKGAAEKFMDDLAGALRRDRPALDVVVQAADEASAAHTTAIANAIASTGASVSTAYPYERLRASRRHVVVPVASHFMSPTSAAALMAEDRPHLPIVLGLTAAEVGPFILPGETACLACITATCRDTDPAWPLIAAQLLGRGLDGIEGSVVAEAGIVAGRLLAGWVAFGEGQPGRTVTIRAGSLRRTEREHLPHPECGCRSLAEGGSTPALIHLEMTTPRACAKPA